MRPITQGIVWRCGVERDLLVGRSRVDGVGDGATSGLESAAETAGTGRGLHVGRERAKDPEEVGR